MASPARTPQPWAGRPVQIVRAVAQRHLRQLHPHPHPVGRDVIEVVEVDAAYGQQFLFESSCAWLFSNSAEILSGRTGRLLKRIFACARDVRERRPGGQISGGFDSIIPTGATAESELKRLKSGVSVHAESGADVHQARQSISGLPINSGKVAAAENCGV